ncbi:MAG: Asp-tRNA(Asn)/Glu-tRNA(Gln) amidotransferase subunit GatB [Armatimonadota bacterium]|nr:Asp-tRNA(Asn)/Glu-tRNA(Gln) amidotransferase subunit GatB [Armatimonadota bacterium]MDR7448107.1 Asp-tRNA(Asn)/Glu-tRNA(Gln) amidotransferase subunit GatB [Armatimonadota bacterium]MDR7459689.1 Asp-tRNA(Asn)/Glu-tRNA(Gln) amidotransferase subunit GatB [Armatimonadota bacterium]MDR7478281.1 Asp-tRNA(Asn)/Glu-tRNA(Gln) amidotransferase subunit GatB [Armatimonadota bacterium]MDR7487276.1 Asp-tRNA(Asn)/Glu-tRNA(Gln) amidotransferase subunit GatB [Armatimonadota bacterium]
MRAVTARGLQVVIGLEIHAQLLTASKMFCGCAVAFGAPPNTLVCPVCLGLPGALPVPNRRAVELGLRTALALGCRVHPRSQFHRKNYYYPDLPKNYQISQYQYMDHPPLATDGWLEIEVDGEGRAIRIRRVHLEEDTGKLLHPQDGRPRSLVDYNRSGVPLMEIVTQPDLRSPAEAREFLLELRALLQTLEVSAGRMEEGTLRVDANISLRRPDGTLGTRTEVKNLNSLRALERALTFEAERQAALLAQGAPVVQETRHWDERRQVTFSTRTKEEAEDYRYFPEPDLVPLHIDEAWLDTVRASLPELPAQKRARYVTALGLGRHEANLLVRDPKLASFFEATLAAFPQPRTVANWLVGDVAGVLNAEGREIDQTALTPARLADLLRLVEEGRISIRAAKELLPEVMRRDVPPAALVAERGLEQLSDPEALARVVEEVLAAHPRPAEEYRQGKDRALAFLVGQVMKRTGGRANPDLVNRLLRERLRDA